MIACLVALTLCSPGPRLESRSVGQANVQVIRVALAGGECKLRIRLASGFPGTDETFESIVKGTGGIVAAINGAYFDKGTKLPIGDIWTGGKLVRKGLMGTAFCVSKSGRMDIRRVTRHRGVDWSAWESVLACGPALVLDGKVDVDWQGEGFRDPHVTGKTSRMGLGYTKEGELLLVRGLTSQTFEEFASTMLKLGCHEAMNLDSGASRGFYFQGKFIEKPGRRLTNVIAIVK